MSCLDIYNYGHDDVIISFQRDNSAKKVSNMTSLMLWLDKFDDFIDNVASNEIQWTGFWLNLHVSSSLMQSLTRSLTCATCAEVVINNLLHWPQLKRLLYNKF